MTVRIAVMELADLVAVRALDEQVYTSVWSLNTWRTEVEKMPHGRVYVTARIDGNHVGHAGLIAQTDEAHIATVAVDASHRRRRIGAALMLTLAREALGCDLRAMTLEVRPSNTSAQALYAMFGFAPVGTRKGYYGGKEDALVMSVSDIGGPDYRALLSSIETSLADRCVFDPNLESAKALL